MTTITFLEKGYDGAHFMISNLKIVQAAVHEFKAKNLACTLQLTFLVYVTTICKTGCFLIEYYPSLIRMPKKEAEKKEQHYNATKK